MPDLVDQDIAHIRRVLPRALQEDLAGPVFPAAYWRRRLHDLLGAGDIDMRQVGEIETLLGLIDEHERVADAAPATPNAPAADENTA